MRKEKEELEKLLHDSMKRQKLDIPSLNGVTGEIPKFL